VLKSLSNLSRLLIVTAGYPAPHTALPYVRLPLPAISHSDPTLTAIHLHQRSVTFVAITAEGDNHQRELARYIVTFDGNIRRANRVTSTEDLFWMTF
jgi:hypothetical protein